MEALIKEIREDVRETRKDVKALIENQGRNHERIRSLESFRKWIFGILGTVIAAVIITVIV
jgi:hypothetical protein